MIELTKNQADALRGSFAAINHLQQIVATRVEENARFARALVLDSGADAKDFFSDTGLPQYDLWESEGKIFLRKQG